MQAAVAPAPAPPPAAAAATVTVATATDGTNGAAPSAVSKDAAPDGEASEAEWHTALDVGTMRAYCWNK